MGSSCMTSNGIRYTTCRSLVVSFCAAIILGGCAKKPEVSIDTGLRPAPNWYGTSDDFEYVSAVHRVLFAEAPRFRETQMLSTAQGNREQAIFIDATHRDEQRYEVVHVLSSESIRLAYSEDRLEKVTSTRKTASIGADLAKLLSRTWFCAVAQSRYKPLRIGVPYTATLDGTTYDFGTSITGAGWAAASTVSPRADSIAGRLVAIGELLIAYANAPDSNRTGIESSLRQQTEGLWADLLGRNPDSEVCTKLI